ncbi:MAG TPA: hypothetical protein VGG75_19250 [Trebonia sp.]|jgi:hypothetical protein
MRADLLTSPIDGLDEAHAAVDAFDQVLVAGLLRPGPGQAAGLAGLTSAVARTPLAARVTEAAEKAAAGTAAEDHYLALAAARTALLGSVHDALLARISEATGRSAGDEDPDGLVTGETTGSGRPGPGAPPTNLLAAARSWLADLARAGWQGLDSEVVSGSAPVISAMLPDLRVRRLAALLDGFATELAASCPGASMERFPTRRWADLWSRAMMLTVPGALGFPASDAPTGESAATDGGPEDDSMADASAVTTATGRLLPLGIDLHEHATAVQAQVHAVLEPAGGGVPRLVRASVSAPKTDTIVGAGVWQLLRPHLSLLSAVSEGRSMDLTGMPLTAAGDLIWSDEHARLGEPADSFATARVALSTAVGAPTAPLDRHPAAIAVPVLLEGYTVPKNTSSALTFTVAGHPLAVDTDRVPAAGPLTPAAVAKSGACIGLLRWDAGAFALQPLAVETTVKKKAVTVHGGGWAGGTTDKAGVKAEKAAADAATVLRERAGRLLRK